MARNDGIDRTVARNQNLPTLDDVAKIQEHNEREKDSYSNQDIVPERTPLNVHFKVPTDDYVKMFEQMEQDGVISTRGLKPDAVKYGELIFDVNSAYSTITAAMNLQNSFMPMPIKLPWRSWAVSSISSPL